VFAALAVALTLIWLVIAAAVAAGVWARSEHGRNAR
jgi:hypothetical protein